MGLYGAAIATGTFHLFRNLFVWRKVRDRARWLNFRAVATWTGLIWGGAILICYALKAALPPNPIVAMACGGVVCALGVLLYVRSPAICASDRELLGKLFHGREARWMRGLGLLPEPGHVP
jgi:O-antigen/teichoic acid export membrane protein